MTRDAWGALAAVTVTAALTLGVALTEPTRDPHECARHGGTIRTHPAIRHLRPATHTYCDTGATR